MTRDYYTVRKAMQGYQSPWQRPACRTCVHGTEIMGRERRSPHDAMQCRLGGFHVSPLGICPSHEPVEITRAEIGG